MKTIKRILMYLSNKGVDIVKIGGILYITPLICVCRDPILYEYRIKFLWIRYGIEIGIIKRKSRNISHDEFMKLMERQTEE